MARPFASARTRRAPAGVGHRISAEGVPVSLVRTGRDDALGVPPPTRTDAQGRYRLEDVPDDPNGYV
ncbi:MAG TPA: hypothetical protein VND21_03185, partial [Planctomycetota bacterium]|nr:hypothetical protein [Planctomycetota bacterium]